MIVDIMNVNILIVDIMTLCHKYGLWPLYGFFRSSLYKKLKDAMTTEKPEKRRNFDCENLSVATVIWP